MMTISSALLNGEQAVKELFDEEYNNTTRQRLSRLIKDGHIKAIKSGKNGKIYIPRGEIRKFHQTLDLDNQN